MIGDNYNNRQVPSRGLLFGTCTEISQSSGVPAWVVRVAAVAALVMWFKLTLLAYCGAAIYFRYRR